MLHYVTATVCYIMSQLLYVTLCYSCNCLGGYELADEFTCTDIDECAADSGTCSPGQCINTPGSHICYCEDGYHSISVSQLSIVIFNLFSFILFLKVNLVNNKQKT